MLAAYYVTTSGYFDYETERPYTERFNLIRGDFSLVDLNWEIKVARISR